MPAYPYRKNRTREPIERYRDPDLFPHAVRGALIGLAAGTALWVVVVAATNLAYRWWVG